MCSVQSQFVLPRPSHKLEFKIKNCFKAWNSIICVTVLKLLPNCPKSRKWHMQLIKPHVKFWQSTLGVREKLQFR